MKKILLLGAFITIGFFVYAQSGEENNQPAASDHGKTISELSTTTEATGREKGAMISSAARAKSLVHANANARFIRGESRPENANASATTGSPATLPAVAINPTTNGKPTVLPPVTPPTTGRPAATPVGRPIGVPVGSKPN